MLRGEADGAVSTAPESPEAPLGVTLSLPRRRALLAWAEHSGAWIIADDYLSELQLQGRAAPALPAVDRQARVPHIGTFSKTIAPALAARFGDVAACLAPAPGPTVQHAVTEFLRDGHHLRHLRRMKRLDASRRDALKRRLGSAAPVEAMAGLAVLLRLPDGTRDQEIAARALAAGLAPAPLSPWYAERGSRQAGLLLGVTNAAEPRLAAACTKLKALIRSHG